MADSMVTARMPRGKKEAGNRVFEKLGMNASQVINDLYDYVIANGALPFEEKKPGCRKYTKEEIDEARAFVRSIPIPDPDNVFLRMSKNDIRKHRLISQGLMTQEVFE